MRTRRSATYLLLACAVLGAARARAEELRVEIQLAFTGTSTLHAFEGTGAPVAASLTHAGDGTWSAEASVAVADLDTGNGWRDASMRTMFDAGRHPRIQARVRGVDPERVRETRTLPFALRIRDVELPLEAHITQWRQSERRASFVAEFDVSLAAFGLAAPQGFFLSVGDSVHVSVRVQLERT